MALANCCCPRAPRDCVSGGAMAPALALAAHARKERLDELKVHGNDILSWGQLPPKHPLSAYYQQADKVRGKGYERLAAGLLPEAFVLLMRFTRFFDVICAHPSVRKGAPQFVALRRELEDAIVRLEEIHSALSGGGGDPPPHTGEGGGAPLEAAEEEPTHLSLEERFHRLKPLVKPKTPPPPPPMPPPPTQLPPPAYVAESAGEIEGGTDEAEHQSPLDQDFVESEWGAGGGV